MFRSTRLRAQQDQGSLGPDESQSFSNVELSDEELYRQVIEELPTELADDIDPEGKELTLEDLMTAQGGIPASLRSELLSDDVWGPPAVVLAGFRAEEPAMVRAILDAAGGREVKVIPCDDAMLYEPLSRAVSLPEPNWEQPRPEGWTRGGAWGSQRTVLFSGMKLAAQAALVELVEEQGLPPVCAALAVQEDADVLLGRVLAQAVQAQRTRRNPRKNIWEELDQQRIARDAPDISAILAQRAAEIQQDLDAGNLGDIYVRDDESEGSPDIPLSELHARQQQREMDEPAVSPTADNDEVAGISGSSRDGTIGSSPDATAVPAAEDPSIQDNPMSPAADRNQPEAPLPKVDTSANSVLDRREELDRPSSRADTDAAAESDSGTASPGVRTQPSTEQRGSPADREYEAKKLAKQQELFGSSFSKPKRPMATAIDREELSESALSDPLTPRENRAVESQVASAPATSGRPTQDQVEQDTAAAGKAFMDGLAQNVGLASESLRDEPSKSAASSGPAPRQPVEADLIDAIAEGRLHASPSTRPDVASQSLPRQPPAQQPAPTTPIPQQSRSQTSTQGDAQKAKVELHMSTAGRDKATERIMKDLDSTFAKMRSEVDRDKVADSVRKEALGPTRDAIKAALACGLKAEDLKQLIDEEAAHHEIHAGTLGQPWRKIPTMTPGPTELADRGRHDILSPQPIPRSQPAPAQAQPSKDETARPANEASAQTAQMGAEEGGGAMPGEGRAMSKSQLRKLAERRGLSYDLLLADAAAQGIELAD
ncbi:g10877 [Coccomyxa viridis]|uniref:G10877 protein n=1 Tax=Coccomyxa viridis TaxID=1274662 RepID=A0ABP1G923_9CHLO